MKYQPVKSSNIESIGYDAASQEMRVKFKGGGIYSYSGVSPEKHQQLMAADSVGSHLHKFIKPHHAATKL